MHGCGGNPEIVCRQGRPFCPEIGGIAEYRSAVSSSMTTTCSVMMSRTRMPSSGPESPRYFGPLSRQKSEDLVILGKTSCRTLAEDRDAIDLDLENATGSWAQTDHDARPLLQKCRQTGGTWQVVSHDAILDLDSLRHQASSGLYSSSPRFCCM